MVSFGVSESTIKALRRRAGRVLRGAWLEVFEEFTADLMGDPRGLALTTIYSYMLHAFMFLEWLMGRGVEPEGVGWRDVRDWVLDLRGRGVRSFKNPVMMLRRLLRFLGKADLAVRLKLPKPRVRVYRLPTPQDVEDFISWVGSLKVKVATALMFETGMRIGEVLNLRKGDVIEEPEGYFRIIVREPKNGEERIVYVVRYAGLLRTYLQTLNTELLFPNARDPGRPISATTIRAPMIRYSREKGIKIYPHLLRHLRGTLLVKEGLPERVVMRLLGHKSERMMRIYINLSEKDVEQLYLKRYGIKKEDREEGKQSVKCPKCGAENPSGARYCWRCGYPLTQAGALQKEASREKLEEVIEALKKLLKERPELAAEILSGT